MEMYTTSGYQASHLRELALESLEATLSSNKREMKIQELSNSIETLHYFIYEYTNIDDPKINTNDEIINWTFVDVIDDLNAANWNLMSGFYKTSASCLRNALDLAIVSLYFQLLENDKKEETSYNKYFANWDSGQAPTPNWGVTKGYIGRQKTVIKFNDVNSCKFEDEIYDIFKYLCNFTHSRPFSPEDNLPTNSMNMGTIQLQFDNENFSRFIDLAFETISWIATAWLISFPQMILTTKNEETYNKYVALLITTRAKEALIFSKGSY